MRNGRFCGDRGKTIYPSAGSINLDRWEPEIIPASAQVARKIVYTISVDIKRHVRRDIAARVRNPLRYASIVVLENVEEEERERDIHEGQGQANRYLHKNFLRVALASGGARYNTINRWTCTWIVIEAGKEEGGILDEREEKRSVSLAMHGHLGIERTHVRWNRCTDR